MPQLYVSSYENALIADLIADSGFDPATDEVRTYVKTNLVDLAESAAPLFPTVFSGFFVRCLDSTVNKGSDANVDWQRIHTAVVAGRA